MDLFHENLGEVSVLYLELQMDGYFWFTLHTLSADIDQLL